MQNPHGFNKSQIDTMYREICKKRQYTLLDLLDKTVQYLPESQV